MKSLSGILFLALLFLAQANDTSWNRLILEKIVTAVIPETPVKLYTQEHELIESLTDSRAVALQSKCSHANIVLRGSASQEQCGKPAIVFSYSDFIAMNDAVGVFYWQKGRPTIRFSQKRLEKFGLNINGEMSKFVSNRY